MELRQGSQDESLIDLAKASIQLLKLFVKLFFLCDEPVIKTRFST